MASRTEQAAERVMPIMTIFRRSNRSARCPPGIDNSSTGNACTPPTMPRASETCLRSVPVRLVTSHCTATLCTCRPMTDKIHPSE